jgi:hypothetical protein
LDVKNCGWFKGRLCKYCGINPDAIEDMSVLFFSMENAGKSTEREVKFIEYRLMWARAAG